MKIRITPIVFAIIIFLTSCGPSIEGNGIVTKVEHEITEVTSVDINGQFLVELNQGKKTNLTIETDENIHDYIKIENNGNTLKVSLEALVTEAEELTIYLTLPNYEMIDLSGAVELSCNDKIKSKSLSLDASGATEVDLDLKVDKLNIDMSGASELKLSGKAENVNIDLSGASELEAYKLEVENMILEISGAGNAEVNVSKKLSVDISGAGEVKYIGEPEVDKEVSGAGSIISVNSKSK